MTEVGRIMHYDVLYIGPAKQSSGEIDPEAYPQVTNLWVCLKFRSGGI